MAGKITKSCRFRSILSSRYYSRRTWCVAFRPARAIPAKEVPALTVTPARV